MDKIKKLIKEVLLNHKHDCGCGCHGKCAKAPMLNENLGAKVIMTENMQYHIDNKKALTENTFRYGSKAFLDLWAEARYLYSRDAINLSGEDKIIVETTHLGEYGLFEGEMVPLDLPIMEEVDEAISGADTDEIFALTRLSTYSFSKGKTASHSGSVTEPTFPINKGSAKAYVELKALSAKCNLV